jgi:hypothetical protein
MIKKAFISLVCIANCLVSQTAESRIVVRAVDGMFDDGGSFSGTFSGDDGGDGMLQKNELTNFVWSWSALPNVLDETFDLSHLVLFSYNVADNDYGPLQLVSPTAGWDSGSIDPAGDVDFFQVVDIQPVSGTVRILTVATIAIPEPTSAALTLAAILCLVSSRRR